MTQPTARVSPEAIVSALNNTGSTIPAGTFVKLVSTAALRVAVCGAGQLVYGVTMNDIGDGNYGDVQIRGKALVVAGATIAIADQVSSDASGQVRTAVAGDTTAGQAVSAGSVALGLMEVELGGPGGGVIVPTPPPPT